MHSIDHVTQEDLLATAGARSSRDADGHDSRVPHDAAAERAVVSGELPLDLQPKLLRVLERKEIRRVGSNEMRPVDVRMIAATHRDLRMAVNQGHFRSDLYFRLAVVRVTLPPLRSRPSDLQVLVERLLQQLGASDEVTAKLATPAFVASLATAVWPGNVRELRNFLERCIVFQRQLPVGEHPDSGGWSAQAEPPGEPAPAA